MTAYTADRRTVLSAVSTGSLAAIAGCTGGADDGDDTFRLSVPFFPETLDPVDQALSLTRLGIIEGLFRITEEGEVEPHLAADWQVSDDSLTWTFELRNDATFHDGRKLDAAAAAFSLNRAFSNSRSRLQGLPIEFVDEVDDLTVSITTSEPFAPLVAHLSRAHAGLVSPNSVADDGTIEEPIGTGPYAFESWVPDEQLTMVSNETYYDGEPEIDRVRYEKVTDGQTKTLKLRNGELDLVTNLPNSAVEELRTDSDTELHLNEGVSDRIIVFNTEREPIDDYRVRQAVLYGINKEEIAEFVLDGVGIPSYGPWNESNVEWVNENAGTYRHDPERAEALLRDAGWELDDEVRYRNGEPLEGVLWAYTERPNLPDIAEAMQAQLSEVGFGIDVRVTEWGALEEAKTDGEYDMSIEHWGMWGSPPDPDVLTNYYHPERNIIDSPYDNPKLTELLREGRTTLDRERRREIYDEVQEIIMEDVSVGFLSRACHRIHLIASHSPDYFLARSW